jgi:predicted AAA+ superfamily ATPase
MKSILLNQLEERNRLLNQQYVERINDYDIQSLLHNPMIKLITGPRRVGKSVFALMMLKQTNFAYLNFDDNQLLNNWDENLVMHTLQEIYPNYEYLLLDEVQNLKDWDLWVSTLYRRGHNLIITGSNARMLSQEMATVLTGRYIPIMMLPFSLQETLQLHNINLSNIPEEKKAESELLQEEYLHQGGYPEVAKIRTISRTYLSTLYDSILLKDIAQRHKIRKTEELYTIAGYLLSNFCNLFTTNDLAAEFNMKSVTTTQKYLNYLNEPYLFFYLQRFNNKFRVMKKAARKAYIVDNGFIDNVGFQLSENKGRLLENQTFIELIRQGYNTETSLFYYHSRNNKEVDFVTRKGTKIERLIQVCYDLSSEKTRKREIDSLLECAEELRCNNLYIVTYNQEEIIQIGTHQIHIIPFHKF